MGVLLVEQARGLKQHRNGFGAEETVVAVAEMGAAEVCSGNSNSVLLVSFSTLRHILLASKRGRRR